MNPSSDPTVQLASNLIRCATISPETGGIDSLLNGWFSKTPFRVQWIEVDGVKSCWAEAGNKGPMLCFAGHYDVVPPGELDEWKTPPFEPDIREGLLYGRGASDMKGPVAAFMTASERFLQKHSQNLNFRLGILLAGDEEPEHNHGTVDVLKWLEAQGRRIDHCIVTEPTSSVKTGDIVKVGRRGSFQGLIKIEGKQGHSAYPEWALNPISQSFHLLQSIDSLDWGGGTDEFQASRLQFTNIHAGAGATNVIPGTLNARFNLRFSPEWSPEEIRARVQKVLDDFKDVKTSFQWSCDARPFLTPPGAFRELVGKTIQSVCGFSPGFTTGGGTSDARFIAAHDIEVIELGPPGPSSHMVDEHMKIDDLADATTLYEAILESYQNFQPE